MKSIEEVSEWIKSRRSLYPAQMQEDAKIPDEDIWKLLENANYAPSHKRTEPWRYIVFADEAKHEMIDKMVEIFLKITPRMDKESDRTKKLLKRKNTLSHIVAICMNRDEQKRIPEFEEEYAVACSVQNILLSMNALNIIGYWSTGKITFTPEMKSYLNLGDKDKCLGFLLLGVPKPGLPLAPKQQMSSIENKVVWRK